MTKAAANAVHDAGENAFSYGLLHGRKAAEPDRVEADVPAARRWPG